MIPLRLLASLSAIIVAGCVASGTTSMERKPRSAEIDHSKIASLRIDAPSDEDAQAVRRELLNKLFGALVAQGIFHQVVQPADPADYVLVIKLSDVSLVSEMGRFYGSIFAGPSKLTAAVSLSKSDATEPILAATITAKSALDEHYGQSTIHDAIDKAVENIVGSME